MKRLFLALFVSIHGRRKSIRDSDLREETVYSTTTSTTISSTSIVEECTACSTYQSRIQQLKIKLDNIKESNKDIRFENNKILEDISSLNQKVFPAGLIPASCQEYLDEGLVLYHDDQMYQIRPDLNQPPFWVQCHFEGTLGFTLMYPNMTNEDGLTATPGGNDGCFDPGCYTDTISYNSTTAEQIEALVSGSVTCHQKVTHTCHVNALTRFAFWVDRHGAKNEYWHGDTGDENGQGCACLLDDSYTCSNEHNPNNNHRCNCDDLDSDRIDEGTITSIDKLPIMELQYGDSSAVYSWIEYNLGPLVCGGKAKNYPSDTFSSRFFFKAAYDKNVDGENIIESGESLVFPEKNLVFRDIIADETFGAIENSEDVNGTAFRFTAPVAGFYQFNLRFTQVIYDPTYGNNRNIDVRFKINEQQMFPWSEHFYIEAGYPLALSKSVEIQMDEGDVMTVEQTFNNQNWSVGDILCQTEGRQHSCNYITGEIIYRL